VIRIYVCTLKGAALLHWRCPKAGE